MSENIKYITDSSFDSDVLKSDKPVLVDFWAEWCGPCRMQGPIIDTLAGKVGDLPVRETEGLRFG